MPSDFNNTTSAPKSDVVTSAAGTPIPMDAGNQEIEYCFSEGYYLEELKRYIDKTYGQHYAKSKIQSTEFIMDAGHGEGFCIGNIIKYAQRYGKKAGYNRADLLKVCHYAVMMLHVHDRFNSDK
jgi:hypothetical protein